jgi:SAM-dependent methyltransferase
MDRQTIEHYDRDAAATAARHRAVALDSWRQQFTDAFPAGCRVLDVGAGSGRDLALLLSLGYDAHGCEPSAGMREEAVRAYPQLAGLLSAHALPFPEDADLGGAYDAVVCSAVFMHAPEAEAFDAAFSLRRVLREKGRLLVALPQVNCYQRGCIASRKCYHGQNCSSPWIRSSHGKLETSWCERHDGVTKPQSTAKKSGECWPSLSPRPVTIQNRRYAF